ncbi:MAG: lipoprotein [Gammaproteobacteria bacterium]|nr:lipoprotein [Gammaproteobacteria bacterium]
MKKTIRWKGVMAIICMVFLITACGQKGDLYLPQGNHLTGWIG